MSEWTGAILELRLEVGVPELTGTTDMTAKRGDQVPFSDDAGASVVERDGAEGSWWELPTWREADRGSEAETKERRRDDRHDSKRRAHVRHTVTVLASPHIVLYLGPVNVLCIAA